MQQRKLHENPQFKSTASTRCEYKHTNEQIGKNSRTDFFFLGDCYISFRLAFDITNESLRNTLNMWSMEMKYIHMYCKRESISHSNMEIANMYFVNTSANKNRILYNRVPYPKESLRTFWWYRLKTLVHLAPINYVLLL